jgi:hypothetical protein
MRRKAMPQFMLVLHGNPPEWQKLSPEEMQKVIEKYFAWRKRPYVVDGKRLTDDPGRLIRATTGEARVTDGPYSETKEIFGGYYTIEAGNYDEAVKLTLDHPQLEYFGGTVEVRQVFGM